MPISVVGTSSLPSGSVLQVVEDSTTTSETTTSTSVSAQKVSALSVNITPTSTSSKILILVNLQSYNDTANASTYYHLFKDGSLLTTSSSNLAAARHFTQSHSAVTVVGFNYLDTPSTTSQITYDIRYYVSNGTGYLSVNQGQSSITVMEIAG